MNYEPDMVVTPERQIKIKETLIHLWEDQMGGKLERVQTPPTKEPA